MHHLSCVILLSAVDCLLVHSDYTTDIKLDCYTQKPRTGPTPTDANGDVERKAVQRKNMTYKARLYSAEPFYWEVLLLIR